MHKRTYKIKFPAHSFRKSVFTILGILFLSLSLFAQEARFSVVEKEELFQKKMAKITRTTQTITSDFVQEKQLSFMDEPIISSGAFFFKKEQKIRWEYQQPFNYLVILNGDELLINDEGHKSEIDLKRNKTFQEINNIINNSLQGNVWEVTKDFESALLENEELYLIQLTPQTEEMTAYLTKIEVFFDKESYQLKKVILFEGGDDFTKITFKNRKINGVIGEENFRM